MELTGTLAGLTLAIANGKVIGLIGLITGFAASLSMGTSEYLSTRSEAQGKNPIKASIYTGLTYLAIVILLIMPYFLLNQVLLSLILTLKVAIVIILFFTFYLSVAQDLPFKKRFLEMAAISLGVSFLTFLIGFAVKKFLGIQI